MEHVLAIGDLQRRPIRVSTLNSSALLMTCLGADRILIPTPGSQEKAWLQQGLSSLPPLRRKVVRAVDLNGRILARVREFLQPLRREASKWPEDAFIDFSETTLYGLALGCRYGASITGIGLEIMWDFLPIIDPHQWTGEAKYRLAELALLFTRYEPFAINRPGISGRVSEPGVRRLIWDVLGSSEFGEVTKRFGRLGYLRHPRAGIGRVAKAVMDLVSTREFKSILAVASAASELASLPVSLSVIERIAGNLEKGRGFSPPVIELSSRLHFDISQASLTAYNPKAVAPKDSLFVLEHMRAGAVGHSWLNLGEETKLADPRSRDLKGLRGRAIRARSASMRMVV